MLADYKSRCPVNQASPLKTRRLQPAVGVSRSAQPSTEIRPVRKLSYCHHPEYVIDLNIAQARSGISAIQCEPISVPAMKMICPLTMTIFED
jgi:hypothetical protein